MRLRLPNFRPVPYGSIRTWWICSFDRSTHREGLAMQLTMTDEEARTLKNLLESYLPELRMEAARTDLPARELRHELLNRTELAERLVNQLQSTN
jgi:hypothetical protein